MDIGNGVGEAVEGADGDVAVGEVGAGVVAGRIAQVGEVEVGGGGEAVEDFLGGMVVGAAAGDEGVGGVEGVDVVLVGGVAGAVVVDVH